MQAKVLQFKPRPITMEQLLDKDVASDAHFEHKDGVTKLVQHPTTHKPPNGDTTGTAAALVAAYLLGLFSLSLFLSVSVIRWVIKLLME